jgi:hypothetical protein
MPLWATVARPMAAVELAAALALAQQNPLVSTLAPLDRALLDHLLREFAPEGTAADRHVTEAATLGDTYGLTRLAAGHFIMGRPSGWLLGWAADSYRAAAWSAAPAFALLAGREHIGWGPGGTGGLLFSEVSGGFDHVQVAFQWRRVRFRKAVGWMDGGRSIVATRMDIPYRPNLRFGFADAVLMEGGPYFVYALLPAPVILTPYLSQQLRQLQGFDDNYLMTMDVEWVPKPGWRWYGELLIDDYTVPTPTANFPSRWGLTVGLHHVAANDGGEWRVQYTIVPNWTYSTSLPTMHYLLRGLPVGHPLGADFDTLLIHASSSWISYVRKGEGQVGRIWSDETEAWQHVFLRGVVEHSVIVGVEIPVTAREGWKGTLGPWLAHRTNAGHILGATRLDAGIALNVSKTY